MDEYNPYKNMTLRQELEARFNEADRKQKEQDALDYIRNNMQSQSQLSGNKNTYLQPSSTNADVSDFLEKYVDELAQLNPGYRMGQAIGTLRAAQQEMKRVKKDGYDNYAHRLGMCLNAQQGADMALYSLGGGILKEAKDILCKTTGFCDKQVPFNMAWNDSMKDMHNNIEGIKYGLQNPDKSCKIWLNDLDYGSNTWKR